MNKVYSFSLADYDVKFDKEAGRYFITAKYESEAAWIDAIMQHCKAMTEDYEITFYKVGHYLYCLDNQGETGKTHCYIDSDNIPDKYKAMAYCDMMNIPIYHNRL